MRRFLLPAAAVAALLTTGQRAHAWKTYAYHYHYKGHAVPVVPLAVTWQTPGFGSVTISGGSHQQQQQQQQQQPPPRVTVAADVAATIDRIGAAGSPLEQALAKTNKLSKENVGADGKPKFGEITKTQTTTSGGTTSGGTPGSGNVPVDTPPPPK